MPRFTVTYHPETIVRRFGAVEITVAKAKANEAQAKRETIEADYFRVENGHLMFRCYPPHRGDGYPETVKVFAPGIWSEVDREL